MRTKLPPAPPPPFSLEALIADVHALAERIAARHGAEVRESQGGVIYKAPDGGRFLCLDLRFDLPDPL